MQPFHFIQLADTQFGMFASFSGTSPEEVARLAGRGLKVRPAPRMEGFAPETALFEEAIRQANRLRPKFVVLCGDMVNDMSDLAQVEEVKRIATMLDPEIPLHWVAGNHDAGADTTVPNAASLAAYRAAFGDDYFAFQQDGASFIVLNTVVMQHPEMAPDEWDRQLRFLESELEAARRRDSSQIIVFTHHPLFGRRAGEEDSYWTIPLRRRRPVLELLHRYGVSAVFAGHWHRNNYARDDGLQMVASGPVGYPLGDDPSGYRVVKVFDDRIEHTYHALQTGLDTGSQRG